MKKLIILLLLPSIVQATTVTIDTEIVCRQDNTQYICDIKEQIMNIPDTKSKNQPSNGLLGAAVIRPMSPPITPILIKTARFVAIEIGTALSVEAIKELISQIYIAIKNSTTVPPIKIETQSTK